MISRTNCTGKVTRYIKFAENIESNMPSIQTFGNSDSAMEDRIEMGAIVRENRDLDGANESIIVNDCFEKQKSTPL